MGDESEVEEEGPKAKAARIKREKKQTPPLSSPSSATSYQRIERVRGTVGEALLLLLGGVVVWVPCSFQLLNALGADVYI